MLTSFARGAKSKLTRLLVGGSILFGLGGCLTPRGEQMMRGLGYGAVQTYINESVRKEMGHNDYQPQREITTEVSIPSRQEQITQPIFFNAAKKVGRGEYEDIRDVFYPGDTIIVVAKNLVGSITNFALALDKGDHLPRDLVKGSSGIMYKGISEPRGIAAGNFNASELLREGFGNNYRVYWLVNDKIVGNRDFVIMNKRPENYSSQKN